MRGERKRERVRSRTEPRRSRVAQRGGLWEGFSFRIVARAAKARGEEKKRAILSILVNGPP